MIRKVIFALTLALVLGSVTGLGLTGVHATHITDNLSLPDLAFLGSPPITLDDNASLAEDTGQAINVLSNDFDPDSEPIFLAAVGAAQHGTTLLSGNTAVYTPSANFVGTDSFTYTASDGSLQNTARVNVTVTASNDKPLVGLANVLYDGALGGTLTGQGVFTYAAIPSFGASQSASSGATTLNTTLAGSNTYAGYSIDPTTSPVLNRGKGYTLRFSAQILEETHTNSDKNGDGKDDRAGFNVIVISSDGRQGIELGFWTDRIWAQNDGSAEPPPNTNTLFTQGESVFFDTTSSLIHYELTVLNEAYTLTVGDSVLLSGSLRDYTAFTPPSPYPDPYETPNFIFLGDNTPSASARVKISYVSLLTRVNPPGRTVMPGAVLTIDRLGVIDLDANLQTIGLTMTVQSGVLTLTTAAPGGLTAGQISGNGSANVAMNGTVGQINRTLAFSPAVLYQSNANFSGSDKATIKVDDRGHTGGGAETVQKIFYIYVGNPSSYLPIIVKLD